MSSVCRQLEVNELRPKPEGEHFWTWMRRASLYRAFWAWCPNHPSCRLVQSDERRCRWGRTGMRWWRLTSSLRSVEVCICGACAYLDHLRGAPHQVVDVVVELQLPLGRHLFDVGATENHFVRKTTAKEKKSPTSEKSSHLIFFLGRHDELQIGTGQLHLNGSRVLPWQLPQRKQDGQFVVQLLKLIESAEDKLRFILTFPEDPHHIGLHRNTNRFNPVAPRHLLPTPTPTARWDVNPRNACQGCISSGRRRWRRGRCVPPALGCKSLGRKTGLARRWPGGQRTAAVRGCGWRSWTWWPRCPDWTRSVCDKRKRQGQLLKY